MPYTYVRPHRVQLLHRWQPSHVNRLNLSKSENRGKGDSRKGGPGRRTGRGRYGTASVPEIGRQGAAQAFFVLGKRCPSPKEHTKPADLGALDPGGGECGVDVLRASGREDHTGLARGTQTSAPGPAANPAPCRRRGRGTQRPRSCPSRRPANSASRAAPRRWYGQNVVSVLDSRSRSKPTKCADHSAAAPAQRRASRFCSRSNARQPVSRGKDPCRARPPGQLPDRYHNLHQRRRHAGVAPGLQLPRPRPTETKTRRSSHFGSPVHPAAAPPASSCRRMSSSTRGVRWVSA